jgi:hypothetical protein
MSQPIHDNGKCPQVQLPPQLADLWESEIVPQLPGNLEKQARQLKALQRTRGIERASDLLRALLAWALAGYSFRQLGCWAVILGIADISEAAWRKRVRKCGDWLQWLLLELMGPGRASCLAKGSSRQARVILVDGTSLGETGGSGDDWRVQIAYDLVEGRLVTIQIGDRHFAETLVGLPGRAGDVFVADRGYGKRANVIALDEMQAAALLRFSPNHCRIEHADGSQLMVSRWLSEWDEALQVSEQEGYCVEGSKRVKVRVLALRLPAEEAEKARERVRARAKRKKQVVRPETLQRAGWVLLLSTLPKDTFTAEELFWLYRNCWHIELLIKQLKQFLLLVQLRSHHLETVRATLLASFIAWLLMEEEGQALFQSLMETPEPGEPDLIEAYLPLLEQWEAAESTEETQQAADPRRPVSLWLIMGSYLGRWRALVLGQWSRARVQACLPRLKRFFCPSPRRRLHKRLWFHTWVQQRLLALSA